MQVAATSTQRRAQRQTATDRLLRAYRERGDVRARDRVMQIYLPLVDTFARRYEGAGGGYEELMRAGSVGLLCAVQSYVPGRGEEFIGFAVPAIADEIRAQLGEHGHPNGFAEFDLGDERLQLGEAFRELDPAEHKVLQLRFVDELTTAEVASRLEISSDEVAQLTEAALAALRRELERLASGQPPAALPVSDADPPEPPPEPPKESHSGRLLLRMPPALHSELASAARRDDVSLNQFITRTLTAAVGSQDGGGGGGVGKPAAAPRWLRVAIVANVVVLAIAAILAAILLLAAWQGT